MNNKQKTEETPLQLLNRISQQSSIALTESEKFTGAQSILAKKRNSDELLVSILGCGAITNLYGENKYAAEALRKAVNKYKLEIIRLAELDLQHKARELKIESKMINEQLTKSIIIE